MLSASSRSKYHGLTCADVIGRDRGSRIKSESHWLSDFQEPLHADDGNGVPKVHIGLQRSKVVSYRQPFCRSMQSARLRAKDRVQQRCRTVSDCTFVGLARHMIHEARSRIQPRRIETPERSDVAMQVTSLSSLLGPSQISTALLFVLRKTS